VRSRCRMSRAGWVFLAAVVLLAAVAVNTAAGRAASARPTKTVWLCRPGAADDPCTHSLRATVVASTPESSNDPAPAVTANPAFDCFYVYPTVSIELRLNSNLIAQRTEEAAAVAQASRFSQVCRVWAPMYRQATTLGLSLSFALGRPAMLEGIAYAGLRNAFEDYLKHDSDGRPIVFIGHSQGSVMLIDLLRNVVETSPSLKGRLALAIIPGGDVEVRPGSALGGTFASIPLCTHTGETGCVIAYSSFPAAPPAAAALGRSGRGVALQSGQTGTRGLEVACVNPAALSGRSWGSLDPYLPAKVPGPTPWFAYPGLYRARCETAAGAAWLDVTKAPGASGPAVIKETLGPDWGYHAEDINLALGNLVRDVAAAEDAWARSHHTAP
jgi:hypothetical protein